MPSPAVLKGILLSISAALIILKAEVKQYHILCNKLRASHGVPTLASRPALDVMGVFVFILIMNLL